MKIFQKFEMKEGNMIRILQLPGNLSKSNGRMTAIMNTYRKIDRSMIQFDFLATLTNDDNYIEEIKLLGGTVRTIKEKNSTFIEVRKVMKEILDLGKYDLVHYHAISEWGMALDVVKKRNIKLITHSHATQLSDNFLKSIRNRIFSMNIFIFSDGFAACSLEAGEKLFLMRKFTFLPNVIDSNKYKFNEEKRQKNRQILGIPSQELVLGNVGRLAKQKNQAYLLLILKELLSRGIQSKLLIVGDGVLKSEIQQKIDDLDLKNHVILTGEVSHPMDYYSAMDVFLLPSLYEGLPMAGIEAQANGLPTIFSDSTSRQANMYNASFLKTNETSVKQWVEEICKKWRVEKRDTNAAYHIDHQGFSADKGAQKWVQLYYDILRKLD